MKKTERMVFYYDLSISASSRTFEAPKTISIKKAFELIKLVPIEQRVKEQSKGRELLYLADWEWTDNIISLLINKSDKGISDPVFTIPKEKKRRTAEKQEEEGQDFSIHIVIRLPENDLDTALVIVEYCAGLGLLNIQKLLNSLLGDAKKISPGQFTQFHPDGAIDEKGNPKKYNVNFKCVFDGHISDELNYDINHGKLHSIELITNKDQYTPFDEDGYIQEKCKTLVLIQKEDATGINNKFNHVKKIFTKQKDNYSKAKIRFKTSTGIERTVEMNTAEGLSQAYVKKEKIDGFKFDLKSSCEKLDKSILLKMKELLVGA